MLLVNSSKLQFSLAFSDQLVDKETTDPALFTTTMSQAGHRDSLRASVFDAYVELGILDANGDISDLVFNYTDEPVARVLDDEDDDEDTRTIGGRLTPEPPRSTPTTPSKSRPSTLSKIRSHFTPRKTSRKVSGQEDSDDGSVSPSSVKRRSRLRKPSYRDKDGSSLAPSTKSPSFFHRKPRQASDSSSVGPDPEWEWEQLPRPSIDSVPDPFLPIPGPSSRKTSTATSSSSTSYVSHLDLLPCSYLSSSKSKRIRRPKSLEIVPKSVSPTATSLPSSPFILVVPKFHSGSETTQDGRQSVLEYPPTPDALMRQYASGKRSYPVSVRKSQHVTSNDSFTPHSRSVSFDSPSRTSHVRHMASPFPQLSRSQTAIPFLSHLDARHTKTHTIGTPAAAHATTRTLRRRLQ